MAAPSAVMAQLAPATTTKMLDGGIVISLASTLFFMLKDQSIYIKAVTVALLLAGLLMVANTYLYPPKTLIFVSSGETYRGPMRFTEPPVPVISLRSGGIIASLFYARTIDAFGRITQGATMWTEEARKQYTPRKERYPSGMTDAEWSLITPMIPPAQRSGRPRETIPAIEEEHHAHGREDLCDDHSLGVMARDRRADR